MAVGEDVKFGEFDGATGSIIQHQSKTVRILGVVLAGCEASHLLR
jgi:hypothetical protein